MRKRILMMVPMLVLLGLQTFAQLNGTGYYRIHNQATGRYITVHDDKGSVKRVGTGYDADLGAIQMASSLEDVIDDPGSIIYLKDLGKNVYQLQAQGVNSKDLMQGYQLTIGGYPDGTYRASVRANIGGVAGRVVLADDGSANGVTTSNAEDEHTRWYITPVNNTGDNYFAVKPDASANGKYYATCYTDFAYQLSAGMRAFYVTGIDAQDDAVMKEIYGKVPAATPVVIQCNSQNLSDNKLLPLNESVAKVNGNKLVGVYFNINKMYYSHKHLNQTAYDPSTMRMVGADGIGALIFTKSSISTIPANKAYLPVPATAPATIGSAFEGDAAPISVTADDITMVYGDAVPELTYTVSGGDITGQPKLTCAATSNSPVGTYPIVVSKGGVSETNVTYYNGTLTIVKAPLTISVADYSRKRGEQNPVFEPVYTGFKNNESVNDLMKEPEISTTATAESAAGVYPIVVSNAIANNYEISYAEGKLTVEKVALQVKVGNYAIKQGDEIPAFDVTISGFVLGEDESVLAKKPVATTTAVKGSEPGEYEITLSGGEDANYDFEYTNGTLTVAPADAIIVKVKDASMVYGDEVPQFTYEVTGGELEGEPQITCSATSDSPVGNYEIVISKGTVSNYNVSFVDGTLTITKAMLKVSVKGEYTRMRGEENPVFELEYEGFRNNDDVSSLTKAPVAATVATANSPEGEYEIVVSGGEAQNYAFTYVNGTLIVAGDVAVKAVLAPNGQPFDVYTISGMRIRSQVTSLEGLPGGLYIVNGKKVAVK